MRCNFVVGQKVVCIDDKITGPIGVMDGLTRGRVYTIRDIGQLPYWQVNRYRPDGDIGVRLVEIDRRREPNPFIGHIEEGMYDHRRFAPLQSRDTDISVFTDILARTPALTDA